MHSSLLLTPSIRKEYQLVTVSTVFDCEKICQRAVCHFCSGGYLDTHALKLLLDQLEWGSIRGPLGGFIFEPLDALPVRWLSGRKVAIASTSWYTRCRSKFIDRFLVFKMLGLIFRGGKPPLELRPWHVCDIAGHVVWSGLHCHCQYLRVGNWSLWLWVWVRLWLWVCNL